MNSREVFFLHSSTKVKPTLVILGTYHMGTPGNNVVNGKVDDIATPERQKQMVELVQALKRFKPTKIAVEIDSNNDSKTQETYEKYLSGKYRLSKSETNQIGFRLAKESGHKKVYCVDWNIFPDDPMYNYEEYASKDAILDDFLKKTYQDLKEEVDDEHERLFTLSIAEQLAFLNQSDQMEKDHRRYFALLQIGRGEEYAGPNYLSWWYRRNLIILSNIIRLIESPDDRILVIYGSGHAKLLTQFAKESAFFQVENPLPYLE